MAIDQLRKYLQKIRIILFRPKKKNAFCLDYIVDDSYLQGDRYEEYFFNVLNTTEILRSLGFTVHPDKSRFIESQCIIYLGFLLNSV